MNFKESMNYLAYSFFKKETGKIFEVVFRFIPLIVFYIWLIGINRLELYFAAIDLYCNFFLFAYIAVLLFAFCQVLVSSQKFFTSTKAGIIIGTLFTMESVMLLVFAQYHFILSIILAAASFAIFFVFRYIIRRVNEPKRERIRHFDRKCRKLTERVTAVVLSLILIVPSAVGFYEEFCRDFLSDEEWAIFLEWYNKEYEQAVSIEKDPNADMLAELSRWDSLNVGDKERLIRTVAMLEKEYLGLTEVEIVIYSEKMEENTNAYYLDLTNEIYINYVYLNEGELEEIIETILHEMHHAYVYHTISVIDFESSEVQNEFYYEKARQWKENSENYISGHFSFSDYYNQPIEADARAHAESRAAYYLAYSAENSKG